MPAFPPPDVTPPKAKVAIDHDPIRASDAVIQRLRANHPVLIDLTTGRVERLLAALGHPEKRLPPVIHVAGTNGKGSTVAFLRAIAEAQGKTVHAITSPHLVRFAERVRIAGELISDEQLDELTDRVEAANDGQPISFFEITTVLALQAFADTPADLCIVEVGLGGRFDATNIFATPAVSVITPIDYDHLEMLGPELDKLGFAKEDVVWARSTFDSAIAPGAKDWDLNIQQFSVTDERKKQDVVRRILNSEPGMSTIIFCNRKTMVRDLAKILKKDGFRAGEIHGDMDQSSRIAELDRFKSGEVAVLVASDVAARGLDVKGVSHVINYDTPWHPDDYVHRIGRTGRAGAKGHSYTLVTDRDAEAIDSVQKLIGTKIPWSDGFGQPPATNAATSAAKAPTTKVGTPNASTPKAVARKSAEPAAPDHLETDAVDANPAARTTRARPGRGKPADKPAAEIKAASKSATKPAQRPAKARPAAVIKPEDADGEGWNGPVPGFLSSTFGQ